MSAHETENLFADRSVRQKLLFGSMAQEICLFMCTFGHTPYKDFREMTPDDWAFRKALNDEEIQEMQLAYERLMAAPTLEHLTEYVDGVMDVIYVTLGSLVKMGVPSDLCFTEVQRSNMAKLQPDGSIRRRWDGKILKPADWTPPDLHGILLDHFDGGVYNANGMRTHDK